MIWPTLCVDNFFDEPDKIIEISSDLDYETSKVYPGKRSIDLHKKHPEFFAWVSNKIMSALYPIEWPKITWHNSAFFQKVPSGLKNDGWVHQDPSCEFTAIIYLSKDVDAGTSIYLPKTFYKTSRTHVGGSVKDRDIHNSKFKETINLKGIFNRLVILDSHSLHAAHVNNSGKERLTLICFFSNVRSSIEHQQLKYIIPSIKRI
tara:strand:- start:719 stop:1330 length:612 start_codon:yes stop_codon:yes gene_type:complete